MTTSGQDKDSVLAALNQAARLFIEIARLWSFGLVRLCEMVSEVCGFNGPAVPSLSLSLILENDSL